MTNVQGWEQRCAVVNFLLLLLLLLPLLLSSSSSCDQKVACTDHVEVTNMGGGIDVWIPPQH
jgi:hypothetical protein